MKDKKRNSIKTTERQMKASSQHLDELIQKQLQDDFQVHEYLNRNHIEGFNTDEYVSLFNKMLAEKMKKQKKRECLYYSSKMSSTQSKSFHIHSENKISKNISSSSTWATSKKAEDKDTYYTEEEYLKIKTQSEAEQEIIQTKIRGELEIQRILWKEIMDNKKSLNLVKGDIGHLIARNQSIKTLESKMNKVSLVATDQLKRVVLALSKDKDEIKLRHEMQRTFHSKLKGMQALQVNNVKRAKISYIQSMKRKKEVYEKLGLIERECAQIQEYSDKKRLKNMKNARSYVVLEILKKLCEVIDIVPVFNEEFENKQITIKEYSNNLKELSENKLVSKDEKRKQVKYDLFDDNFLNEFQEKIIKEYENLQKKIKDRTNLSNQLIKSLQEHWNSFHTCENIRSSLFHELSQEERSQLKLPFTYKDYIKKMNDFSHHLKPIYLLLEFFSNKIKETKISQFASVLDEMYSKLLKFREYDQTNKDINSDIFHELPFHIKKNFNIVKQKILNQQYNKEEYNRNSMKTQSNNHTESSFLSNGENLFNNQFDDNNEIYEEKKIPEKVEKKTEKRKEKGAKRLQLLEKIDLNYYKMIKSTLQMEKENTRKNYQFSKTFKRTKYSAQDELLEEKRFEASFSGLFSQQKVSMSTHSPKEGNTSFKTDKIRNQKINTHFGGSNSVFALTSPSEKKSSKDMGKGRLLKKSKISNQLKEILHEI